MARRRCIWATSQPWHSPFRVSAHHYVRYLLDHDWDVAYLSHPISPLHAVWSRSRAGTTSRLRNWRNGGETAHDGHLYHYCPMTLCPPHDAPLLRSARVLDLWPRLTVPGLRRRLADRGFTDVDLVVLDSERYAALLDMVDVRTTVLRLVDAIGGFDATPTSWTDRIDTLIRRVDHVVVTSSVIAAEIRSRGARSVTHVPNGVETARFAARTLEAPADYAGIPGPRAVYVGAIEGWFDADLVDAAAQAVPGVSFVLVGPAGAEVERLRGRPNVHVLGARPYEQVPRYLAHADVGLIPFRSTPLTRCVNPIKLYEYMAAGLPVVATRSQELEELGSPATLCATPSDFIEAVRETTSTPVDAEPFVAFARGADWSLRASRLMTAIGVETSDGQ